MKFNISSSSIEKSSSDCVIIVYSDSDSLNNYVSFNSDIRCYTSYLNTTKQFDDKKENIHQFTTISKSKVVSYYFVCTHPTHPRKGVRFCFGEIARHLVKKKFQHVDIFFTTPPESHHITEAVEGLVLGSYTYCVYKSDSKNQDSLNDSNLTNINFGIKKTKSNTATINRGYILGNSQNIARNLANCPSNELTPADFIAYAYHEFEGTSVELTCFEKSELEDMNMGALLAVGKGSKNAPYLLKLQLNKSSKKKPIALVGKGVTFDSGGISIKPSRSMGQMKADMSGAAAVLACMKGLHDLDEKRPVIAFIPLVENMPSSTAYKPGDVLTAKNKKTIEVINTDAEGRLILADSLCYATEHKPGLIIDVATLTGACLVALGDVANGICSNRDSIISTFKAQENITGEPAWQLPIYPEFLGYLKSDVADLLNCAENRLAGTSTAAVFLQQFVNDIPWLHIDIASTMHSSKSTGHTVKGMTGTGTRSLIEYVQSIDLNSLGD